MPVKASAVTTIADLQAGRKQLAPIIFSGGDLNVAYNPAKLNNEVIQQLSNIDRLAASARVAAIYQLAVDILADWDCLEDDGTTVALTYERLSKFDIGFISRILRLIFADMTGKKTTSPSNVSNLPTGSQYRKRRRGR